MIISFIMWVVVMIMGEKYKWEEHYIPATILFVIIGFLESITWLSLLFGGSILK